MTLKVDGTNGVLQAYDLQILTTGFTYTFAAGTQTLVITPAGVLATGTVTMPASPVDGMVITITSTQSITALTVNANTGQTINNGGSKGLQGGGSLAYVYNLANTKWQPFDAGLPLSVGQTWTDVTGSRATGTTYTNSTGRPIFVGLIVYPGAAGNQYAVFQVNGATIYTVGQFSGSAANTYYGSLITAIIPDGATYRYAVSAGTVTIYSWFELR